MTEGERLDHVGRHRRRNGSVVGRLSGRRRRRVGHVTTHQLLLVLLALPQHLPEQENFLRDGTDIIGLCCCDTTNPSVTISIGSIGLKLR